MKKNKIWLQFLLTMLISAFMGITVFANTLTWENAPGHHDRSLLLDPSETSSRDIYQRLGKGEIFSTGVLGISNGQDGKIYIEVETYAHRGVDRIQHSVVLEQWNEKKQDWNQIKYWEFERTKEQEGGDKLLMFATDITVSGLSVNKYYRARGLHMVELEGESEGGSTETHGVQLTKR